MNFLDRLFSHKKRTEPEDKFKVSVTSQFIQVEHPQRPTEKIEWEAILEIRMINTDQGPWLPDVWLGLFGRNTKCLIPHGAKGYDEIFEIVLKYNGFDFEAYFNSMTCADNKQFILWQKNLNTGT